jgi:hypothetical protein
MPTRNLKLKRETLATTKCKWRWYHGNLSCPEKPVGTVLQVLGVVQVTLRQVPATTLKLPVERRLEWSEVWSLVDRGPNSAIMLGASPRLKYFGRYNVYHILLSTSQPIQPAKRPRADRGMRSCGGCEACYDSVTRHASQQNVDHHRVITIFLSGSKLAAVLCCLHYGVIASPGDMHLFQMGP